MASLIPEAFTLANPLGDFGFNGSGEHRLSTLAKHLGQHVATRGWKRNRRYGNFLYGGVLLGKMVFEINQIQTQARRLFQLLIHNFRLYLEAKLQLRLR